MKGNGRMATGMEKEPTHGQMETDMKESGRMTRRTEKEL